jgi:uncharacterized protein (TIGR01777 family)
MHIFMTGATGFIGRAAVAHLQGQSHAITAWVRNEARAKGLLGSGVRIVGPKLSKKDLRLEIEHSDAVVNLAGRPLAGVRWTKKNKRELSDSRARIAQLLSEQIQQCNNPPKVFISASAVGYYGDRGSETLEEESGIGKGFLSELCSQWEQAALAARKCGTRVCLLRTGLVLGREGGLLQRLVPGFKLGLGIYIGTDKQRMSWIHLSDMARVIQFCLVNPDISGPVNCTSPSSTSNKDFAKTLASVTNAKMIVPVPSIVLSLLFGEASKVLTQSQDVIPAKLMACGFEFSYKSLKDTLRDEC